MDIDDIFPPEDKWKRRWEMREHMNAQNEFDDLLGQVFEPIKVGDRVRYIEDGDIGTVIDIQLSDSPFRVKWDEELAPNGGDNYTDWFQGSQLERMM